MRNRFLHGNWDQFATALLLIRYYNIICTRPAAVSDDYSGCWPNSFLRFFLHACPSANYVLRTKSHYEEIVCEIAHLISFSPVFSSYLAATNLHQCNDSTENFEKFHNKVFFRRPLKHSNYALWLYS